MTEGDRHILGGREFVETFHGPMVRGACVDCGTQVMVVGRTGRIGTGGLEEDTGATAQARCSACGRAHHGADLAYYGTGRDDVIRRVSTPELDRLRAEASERRLVELARQARAARHRAAREGRAW